MRSRTTLLAGALAAVALAATGAEAKVVNFAEFTAIGESADLSWANPIVPAVYRTIPAVTQDIPAVTKDIPAVTKDIPAVVKRVDGKMVVVTPATTVVLSPAKTIVISPAKTVVLTPEQKVLVTPAHDSAGGVLQSIGGREDDKGLASGSALVKFQFLDGKLTALKNLKALFTFQAASSADDPATLTKDQLLEPGLSGSFSFIYEGEKALNVDGKTYYAGANLLSGVFSNMSLSGAIGGSSAEADAATGSGGTLTYTSDLLSFAGRARRSLSMTLADIQPGLQATSGSAAHSFTARASGGFAAEGGGMAVPEPDTWTVMILGLGGVGLVLRIGRRRRAAAQRAPISS